MAISQAALHSHGAGGCIESDDLVHVFERNELSVAVGNSVEAVTRAEEFQTFLLFEELLDLIECLGRVQIFRTVFQISGPVFELFTNGPGQKRRKEVAASERGTNLKKGSLVHRLRILESVAGGEYNPRTMSLTKLAMRGTKNADYDKHQTVKVKKLRIDGKPTLCDPHWCAGTRAARERLRAVG